MEIDNDTTQLAIAALLAIYELVVRVVPTAKDWSWLSTIIRIIGWIVPNKSKNNGQFDVMDVDRDKLKERRKFLGIF